MLPNFPVKVPKSFPESPDVAEVWANPTARVLALLWRPCHLICQGFWSELLHVAGQIEKHKPKDAESLAACFHHVVMAGHNFSFSDVDRFAPLALPYILGEKEVPFEMIDG